MTDRTRPRISVLMIVLNGERMLDTVLRSVVDWADEIVIVDSGSTDDTESIARRHTEKFHPHPYAGHGLQRRRSMELSDGEWILYIDADEVVTPELRDSILRAVADPGEVTGFRMRLHTRFLGTWFGARGWRREWKTRLFRRDAGEFDAAPIHEGATVRGPIGTLDGALHHYPYRDLDHFAEKMNLYSTAMAGESHRRGARASAFLAPLRGLARFLRDYLVGGDFLYGGPGLIRSTMVAYYTFMKHAKVWEAALPTESLPTDPNPENETTS